ncbi:MAG: LysM peptidoglycan-binding domain-containing protein [Paludibacteraceae bacterium]|nr:LysM peptidoglycan-binding domain-containing protein [Paludibacteraceae bacterium]
MKQVRLAIFSILVVFSTSLFAQNFAYDRWSSYRIYIEELLKQHQLPLHYAYLPLLQTNCDTHHRNPYGSGAWALSVAAARHYGLHILPGYDERHDMKLSCKAAIAYLADLYKHHHGDSDKVLAQFMQCTPKSVTANEISTDFLLRRLQEGCPADMVHTDSGATHTITLEKSIYMQDFCRWVEIDSLALMAYNPSILPKAKYLHSTTQIHLPDTHINQWESAKDTLYACATENKKSHVSIPTTPPKPEPTYIVYRVRSGDTLGHIAMRYHVTVSQLKRWNRLHSDMLQIDQRLKIYR